MDDSSQGLVNNNPNLRSIPTVTVSGGDAAMPNSTQIPINQVGGGENNVDGIRRMGSIGQENLIGGMRKEAPVFGSNEAIISKESKEFEVPPEVKEFVEVIDKENVTLDRPVVHGNKVLVEPATSLSPSMVLPMTHSGVQKGLKQNVKKSVRWLAEWCVRLIKKFHGRVVYSTRNEEV
jgi:hypothetical protein